MILSKNEKSKIIIFGNGDLSRLIHYCLVHDTPNEVVGFTVDRSFVNSDLFEGKPLVPFEEVDNIFPPTDYKMIIPIGFKHINQLRKERYERAKEKGYRFSNYISSRASVWPNLEIGENVIIYENSVIQPFTKIGNNCIIRSSVHLSHDVVVKDHCFIAAGVTTGGNCIIDTQSFIGVSSVLIDSIHIAPKTFIGAGAVVIKNSKEGEVLVGNPAKPINKSSDEVTR